MFVQDQCDYIMWEWGHMYSGNMEMSFDFKTPGQANAIYIDEYVHYYFWHYVDISLIMQDTH